jgi:hypothetical protein
MDFFYQSSVYMFILACFKPCLKCENLAFKFRRKKYAQRHIVLASVTAYFHPVSAKHASGTASFLCMLTPIKKRVYALEPWRISVLNVTQTSRIWRMILKIIFYCGENQSKYAKYAKSNGYCVETNENWPKCISTKDCKNHGWKKERIRLGYRQSHWVRLTVTVCILFWGGSFKEIELSRLSCIAD